MSFPTSINFFVTERSPLDTWKTNTLLFFTCFPLSMGRSPEKNPQDLCHLFSMQFLKLYCDTRAQQAQWGRCAHLTAGRSGSSTTLCWQHSFPGWLAPSCHLLVSVQLFACISLSWEAALGVFGQRTFLHCKIWSTYWVFRALAVE